MANHPESFIDSVRDAFGSFVHSSRKLAAPILRQFGPSSKPTTIHEQDLEILKSKLERIRATLKEAEKIAISDVSVQLWLRELKDLEYSAEDVLEEIEFESLRATKLEKFKVELLKTSSGKRKREASFLFLPSASCLDRKIKKMLDKYNEIAVDRKALRLREGDGERRIQSCPLIPSSSFPKSELHGREKDVKKVIDLLLSDDTRHGTGSVYTIVPIVGMAGVGKTTLVQHIYHDETISSKFDLKMWVWVSQEFDVLCVTRKMGQEILKCSCDSLELNLLHSKLIENLKGNRFLLVLDDMWDEDENRWDSLRVPLSHGAEGSKIIVTTRSMKVAEIMLHKTYRLGCLSDDNCWLVCQEQFFQKHNPNLGTKLVQIGKKIVAKCKGSPLAAKAVASVLRKSIDEGHWNDVLENHLWTEDEIANQIMPALKVSYDYLPVHLKHCFAYCSLFPKGHVFQKDRLVQLWVAQGFVHASGTSSLEYIGGKYFDELVGRCFFQHSNYTEELYVIHDLYHELAQYVSGNECIRTENYKLSRINEQARYSSLVPLDTHPKDMIQLDSLCGHNLRTFLFLGSVENKPEGIPFCMKIPSNLFLNLGCLRVLDLSNTDVRELPFSVGNLIHLRYLGLENTGIECLPETISGLLNMRTVNLKHCCNLELLPQGLKLLSKLTRLELPLKGDCSVCMPSGVGKLTGLEKMPVFVVGSDTTQCGIEELGSLVNLRGELHILGIENVQDAQFAGEANLLDKEKLQKLTLQWSGLLNEEVASEVLNRLRPHQNLKELVIKGFCGTHFPIWLGTVYLLVTLDLRDCVEAQQLPTLGQLPSLRHLSIQSMRRVQKVGDEFVGFSAGFPMLETLSFRKMDAWEEWVGVREDDFPRLRYLNISKCCKLSVLPSLFSLSNLRIQNWEPLLNLPVFPFLKSLKIEGLETPKCLPLLPVLNELETLEISCCKQLLSLGNLQHLVSLQQLKVSKCPLLKIPENESLPPRLKNLFVHGSCPLLTQLHCSSRFEAAAIHDQEKEKGDCRETSCDYPCNIVADADLALVEVSSWYNILIS